MSPTPMQQANHRLRPLYLGVGAVRLCRSAYLKTIHQAETKEFFNLKVDLFIRFIAEDEL